MRFCCFLIVFLLGNVACFAQQPQNDFLIDSLLHQICAEQVVEHPNFPKGTFPSFRKYGLGNKCKADANIFFSSLVVFTLQQLESELTPIQKSKVDSVLANYLQALPLYKNKKGRNTYNFWKTNPPELFPNSLLLSKLSKTKALADDPDDTVFPLMVMSISDSALDKVHTLLEQSSNLTNGKKVKTTRNPYRNFKAHSAWFGKKMPIEFDFSLQCNTLMFLVEKNLPWNSSDSATLDLIVTMVKNKEYLRQPAYISPYYQKTAILMYHLSRLMSKKNFPELEKFKPELIKEALALYQLSPSPIEKVLLNTSLMRWGNFNTNLEAKTKVEINANFPYYTVRLMTYWAEPWKSIWMRTGKLVAYDWYCRAYNQTLLLENWVLRKAHSEQ